MRWRRLKFGLVYPNVNPYCDTKLATSSAEVAEEAGFDAFLIWDHYGLPQGNETFDAWILLAHLAARTSMIRLGTCVTPIPLRPPSILAKIVSSLDIISNGRVIVGVGAGWHMPEFEGYSRWDSSSIRVAKVKEGLQLMLRLWTESNVTFRGRYYSAKDAVLEPKPVQKPHPPLWFGAFGDYMLKLTARFGQGWIPTQLSVREYRSALRKLDNYLNQFGGDKKLTSAYDLFKPERDSKSFIDVIENFREARCEYFAINWLYGRDEFIDRIAWFGREVIPSFA